MGYVLSLFFFFNSFLRILCVCVYIFLLLQRLYYTNKKIKTQPQAVTLNASIPSGQAPVTCCVPGKPVPRCMWAAQHLALIVLLTLYSSDHHTLVSLWPPWRSCPAHSSWGALYTGHLTVLLLPQRETEDTRNRAGCPGGELNGGWGRRETLVFTCWRHLNFYTGQ